jgi:hypothetical protein
MKKFIIKSFVFAVFFTVYFILINVIYFGIIATTDFDFIKRWESLKFDNPNFELLVLGASTSMDAIDPELFDSNGIKSYNLAIGGSSIRTNYIQLNEYMTKCSKRPKYVFLGLNSALVQSFDDNEIQPIVEVTMKDHEYSLNDVPILKFKWLGFEFLKKIVSKKHRKAKLVYGQLKFQKIVSDNTSFNESYLNIQEFESSHWIGEMAKLCVQNEIELIILEMPGYKETQNLSKIGPYKLHFNNGYSANLYNFNSKDFCTIFDSDKDWIGNSHLNEFGAIKFTKELIGILGNQINLN